MAAHDGHAHTGAAHLQLGQVHDLAPLVLHLHLLGGIALERLAADLRDNVVGDLILEHLRLDGLSLAQQLDLVHQFLRAARARAGRRLIRRGDDRLDGAVLIQGVDGHKAHDRGAVGVCDDALMLLHVLGIDLRDDQRHLGVETERRGVVDEHGPGLDDRGGKTLGDVVLRRAEDDVHALERLVARQLDRQLLPLPLHLLPHGARGRQQVQLCDGEVALGENLHHLLAHRAGGAQNGYVILFHVLLLLYGSNYFTKLSYSTRMAGAKSASSTPTMMFSSSGPCVIMRMLMPFSPSVAKILPELPG